MQQAWKRAGPVINVIVIDRKPDRYIFMYEDGRELEVAETAGRWVMSGIGFRWSDAAEVVRCMDTHKES